VHLWCWSGKIHGCPYLRCFREALISLLKYVRPWRRTLSRKVGL
jgi:hypothetical protein